MTDYNNKIFKGSTVRGDQLRLPRAIAIYKAAVRHPRAKDVSCRINSRGDEIILMTLYQLEVPDEPVYDIREEEDVAIICHKDDVTIPEVYALRPDFPTELPHSNARPYSHPVSLCVSDVTFADIRPQFNAYDFIGLIRRWLNLSSINQLHEAERPLEVFFSFHEVCCILNERADANPYVRYSKKTKLSSTLEFVEKSKATHYLISLPTEKVHASNFARIPQSMGDLRKVRSIGEYGLTDSLLYELTRTVAGKATFPLVILVFIKQTDNDNTKTSQDLFLIRAKNSPSEIVQKKRVLSQDTFEQWFNQLPVDVILLDVMAARFSNAISNGITDSIKKVGFIGTGTLGSAVIDHFVREGCSEEVAIVDFDILLPHNISRHTLTPDKVMTSKVRSIRESYRGIFFQKLTAIEGNALLLNRNDKERFYKGTELVVDLSTSIAVERALAHDAAAYRRCTSFLNPKGDEIVLLMEDEERVHRLDLLEMDYYRNLIIDERFSQHLEQTDTIRTNSFSCRAESMILNYENVRALSAICTSQIRRYYKMKEPCLNIWHIDQEDGTVSRLTMKMSDWHTIKLGDVEVCISKDIENEINDMAVASPDKETGGSLFGSYDRDYNSIYVYYMVQAPEDSIHTPVSFVRGFKGLTQKYERITKLTYHQVRYLGEWHSHPNMSNSPSEADNKQFNELLEEQQSQDLPFVQMIRGNNGLYVRAAM